MNIDHFLIDCNAWTGIHIREETPVHSIETVINGVEDASGKRIDRFGNFEEPFISIVAPCGNKYVYQTPNDFPLEDVDCECGDVRHKVVKWTV